MTGEPAPEQVIRDAILHRTGISPPKWAQKGLAALDALVAHRDGLEQELADATRQGLGDERQWYLDKQADKKRIAELERERDRAYMTGEQNGRKFAFEEQRLRAEAVEARVAELERARDDARRKLASLESWQLGPHDWTALEARVAALTEALQRIAKPRAEYPPTSAPEIARAALAAAGEPEAATEGVSEPGVLWGSQAEESGLAGSGSTRKGDLAPGSLTSSEAATEKMP